MWRSEQETLREADLRQLIDIAVRAVASKQLIPSTQIPAGSKARLSQRNSRCCQEIVSGWHGDVLAKPPLHG
jgi:hypothetical protein